MPFTEDQLLPISALQHLLFCERQCALIHIERVWSDNEFTAEGNILHERTHEDAHEFRPGVRITRGLPVRSFELGLSGQCDVVVITIPSRPARARGLKHRLRRCLLMKCQSLPARERGLKR